MTYATIQDCIDRKGEDLLLVLLGFTDPGKIATSTRLQEALGDATQEIDGYLGARYTLPLPSPPKLLRRYAVDIALYLIASEADKATDELLLRYKDATRMLDKISKGTVTLGLPEPEPKTVGGVHVTGSPPRFKRGSMAGLRT